MPGKHITDQQKALYMDKRKKYTQESAAAMVGISERSGRRIEATERQLKTHNDENTDHQKEFDPGPLAPVWEDIILPILQDDKLNLISPAGIFTTLCDKHLDKFEISQRRTLQRKIKEWRTLFGADKEVIFRQCKEHGIQGIFDFTEPTSYTITIKGKPCKHRYFHYRLVSSGWAYANVVYGGESFVAVATGLKNAFEQSGGVPKEVRSDHLSAAHKNNKKSKDELTERYKALSEHYGFKTSTNNKGVPHENGVIESGNRHLKDRLYQALLIRGSFDFDSKEEFESFVQHSMNEHNKKCNSSFQEEQKYLDQLPIYDTQNYEEVIVKISSSSTFKLKRVTYTVPSRLIGSTLCVHVFDNELKLYSKQVKTLTLERIHAPAKESVYHVDYKHLIPSLIKKPRAFRGCRFRDNMLPNQDYQMIWEYLDRELDVDAASIYMVKLLHLAFKTLSEESIGRYVLNSIHTGSLVSIQECEDLFLANIEWESMPLIEQHPLASYQNLLGGVNAVH